MGGRAPGDIQGNQPDQRHAQHGGAIRGQGGAVSPVANPGRERDGCERQREGRPAHLPEADGEGCGQECHQYPSRRVATPAQAQAEHDEREDGRDVNACGLDPIVGEHAPEGLRLGHLVQPELLQPRIERGIGIGEALRKDCHRNDGNRDTERQQRPEPSAEAAAKRGRSRCRCQAESGDRRNSELRD